jgi:hypothetical protein
MAEEAPAENFEKSLRVTLGSRLVQNRERTRAKGGADVTPIVTVGAGSLDHHGRRRGIQAGEQLKDAAAAGLGVGGTTAQRNLQIDDGNMNRVALDNVARLGRRAGQKGGNAEGFKESRQGLGP